MGGATVAPGVPGSLVGDVCSLTPGGLMERSLIVRTVSGGVHRLVRVAVEGHGAVA
jgi:hypothetical protein